MNDITALAQRMKAAAEKATPGEWRVFSHSASGTYAVHTPKDKRCEDVIKWPGFDGQDNAEDNAEFIAAANPANVLALVEALEKALADSSELKPANLINKFYERYPVSSFKSESVRAEALGYFMAGAELQCFGEFVKYEELCSDE